MFRIPSVMRRPLAVAGAAFVGLAAVVVIGSPASAHHPEVSGTASCVEGRWQVEWTVRNSEQDLAADITGATFSPAFTSDTIKVAPGQLPAYQGEADVLRTTQVLDLSAKKATLEVSAHWKRGKRDINATRSATVHLPKGGCRKSVPEVAFTDDCAGQVTVVVSNEENATRKLRFKVLVAGSDKPVATGEVAPGESAEPIVVPVGGDKTKEIRVVAAGGKEIDSHKWSEPEGGCVPETEIEQTCDQLSIAVINPPNGLEFDLVFTPNTGEPQTMKVEKGRTATVTFPASPGLVVTPSVNGEDLDETISWTKPEGCDEDTPTLPKTGANAGAIAGGAGGLLLAGGALFYLARRRRLRFTA
ncbi:LPXTG cell wall anchor domain-containing protein [Asanoa sp. NPDC050611]|uniref:LPXTG cell wall anchor domain-containing protein n=1 Tax=Asanoa sp. NPDC050611 TaxID=3157098 RepID=UPI0033CFB3EA